MEYTVQMLQFLMTFFTFALNFGIHQFSPTLPIVCDTKMHDLIVDVKDKLLRKVTRPLIF